MGNKISDLTSEELKTRIKEFFFFPDSLESLNQKDSGTFKLASLDEVVFLVVILNLMIQN
jgi:hypothetical protein